MKAVYKNFSLGAIEENITNLIKECEIWSDLDLSYDEYDILSQKIFEVTEGKSNILQIQKSYPLVNITHAVNLIIHEDYDEFWDAYNNKLGINLNSNEKNILGKNWKLILEKVGFNKFDNDVKELDIMPIICQAGIPDNELEDIFDIIKYRDMQDGFKPQVLIDELTSWQSYAVGTATKAYMKLYPERAANFFLDINELVNTSEGAEIDEEKYNVRIINRYYEWKEKEKYMGRKRPKNTEVPSPYLMYNKIEKQFSIVFPPYSVRNEYAHHFKYTIADNENNRYKGIVKVKSDGQGRVIKQQTINVKAARAYVVHLYDDTEENPVLDKKITGAFGYGAVIYDCNGKRISDVFTEESFEAEKNILPTEMKEPIFNNIHYKDNFGKENKAIIYWDYRKDYPDTSYVLKKLNDSNFIEKIDITKCKKLKAASGEKHFVYLEKQLESGVYKVYEAEQCDLDSAVYKPVEIDDIHMFRHKEEGYKEKIGSLNEILFTVLMNYNSLKMLKKIKTVVKVTGEKRDSYLDDKGCEILTLLICNFCSQINDDNAQLKDNHRNCAETIEQILKLISLHMLNTEKRGNILQKICGYNLSQQEFELCFDILSLGLSSFGIIAEIPIQQIEKLAEADSITAMRLYLKNTMDYNQGMRLLELVGIEAMQEMFKFDKGTNTQKKWLSCYEALVKGDINKTDYFFYPASKITGNHKEFHDMINWGVNEQNKSPKVLFEAKESEGIPFCGQFYLDLLLSWYLRYTSESEKKTELVRDLGIQISSIDKAYMALEPEIKNSIIFFEKALQGRYIEGKSAFATFYYCGLASVMLVSNIHISLNDETYKICSDFLQKMYQLFPELVERDLLLADMYVMFNK